MNTLILSPKNKGIHDAVLNGDVLVAQASTYRVFKNGEV